MVGNSPNFTKIDVLRCFLKFSRNIGRQELARELELGEGTVRTILEELKSKNLLDSTKKGHFLSKKGKETLKRAYECIGMPKIIAVHGIYPNFKKIGVQVRGAASLKGLYRLRDIAVKNGAEGAIILEFDKRLYAPESGYEQDYKELEKCFDFRDSDALIIAFSEQKRKAENGALAIAVEINSALKKILNML